MAGTLSWRHGGKLVRGVERHYTFVNSSKTELEISDASQDQAGIYEILLQAGGCKILKIIEVEIGLYFFVLFLVSESYGGCLTQHATAACWRLTLSASPLSNWLLTSATHWLFKNILPISELTHTYFRGIKFPEFTPFTRRILLSILGF